ncbi:unnamed protein product [Dicrocoelium dendriticum]|nr:unnamed protein product [Dicrocoelium dendriticum]
MSAVAHSSTLPELDLSGEQPQLAQQAISTYSDSVDQLTWQLHSEYAGPKESVLPREFRQRLHKHFARIEQEFEREYRRLCGENLALQERLEKFEDGDHSESTTLAKKLGASMLSQRIKQQYKQSTSRLVSSLRQSTGHSTGGAVIPPSPMTHGPTHGVPFAQSNSSVQVATSLPSATAGPAVFVGSFAGHGGMWQLMSRVSAHRDGIWEVTPYRRFVASASADTTVRLWSNDVQLNCLLVYMGHCGSVNSVRFRGRDQLMLTSSGDGTAHLIKMPYDLLLKAAGSRASHGPTGVTSPVNQEGTTTATSADVAGSAFSMPMCPTPGTAVKFPLDSDEAVCDSADDGGSSNAPVHVQHPHAVFQSANIYPVGSSCGLTGAANSSATAATGNSMDSSPLSAADFLTCGDQIVTAGWDRLGRIYDLTTGQEVNSLTGHGHQLTDVRCSPAGVPIVVTSSRDCTFRLWDFRQPGMRVHVQQAHTQFWGVWGPQKYGRCCHKQVDAIHKLRPMRKDGSNSWRLFGWSPWTGSHI